MVGDGSRSGGAQAQYKLALACKNGKRVMQDTAKALEWWEKAAEQVDADAQYELATQY